MKPFLLFVFLSIAPIFSHPWYKGVRHSTPFPGADAPFTRAFSAELDGDGWPDVVQLHGALQASIALAPAEREAIVALPLEIVDADVLRAFLPDGRDALVCATAQGLSLVSLALAAGTLVEDASFAPAQGAAHLVRTGDFFSTPGREIAVVGADRTSVRIWSEDGSQGLSSFSALSAVQDILPLRWSGSAFDDLAVLGENEVAVHDPDASAPGLPLFSQASIEPGGSIGHVGEAGRSYDRLVWVTSSGTGEQWLFVLSAFEPFEWVTFGPLGAVASASGDYDLDGFDDLVFAHRFSHELLGLINLRTGVPGERAFTGAVEQIRIFPFGATGSSGASAPFMAAQPLFEDLDRDGDVDAWIAVESSATLEFLHGEALPERNFRPGIMGIPVFEDLPDQASLLNLTLAAPKWLPPATHIQVDAWVQANASAPFVPLGIGRTEVELTSWPIDVSVPIPRSGVAWEDVFGLQIRLVDRSGIEERSYPSTMGLFTMRPDVLDVLTAGGMLPFIAVAWLENSVPSFPGGGIVCRPRIGPFSGAPRQP